MDGTEIMSKTQRPKEQQSLSDIGHTIHAPKLASPSEPQGELVPDNCASLDSAHGAFSDFHADYVGRHIELADTKATWIFAIMSGGIAYCASNDKIRSAALLPSWSYSFLLTAFMFLLMGITAAFAFFVIAPRLRTSGEGIVYFGAVASFKSARDYADNIGSRSEAELYDARLRHCYDLATVCQKKYKWLGRAMPFGAIALPLLLLTLSTV